MAREAINDTKHLFKRGKVWWIQAMRKGERIIQSTGETNIQKARVVRDEVLNPLNLRDEKKRAEAVLAKVEGLDRQLAKIDEELPSLGILASWTAYKNAPNRPDSGKRTMQGYESQFERFADWMKDNHPSVTELRGVTEEIAYAFAAHLGQTQTPNTYNKYMVLFRRMWKVLIKPARLTSNPWAALDNKLLATHSRRELTLEELITVCASVSGEMRTLFAVGLYCGLRLGDAVLLKWSNVDLIRRVLIIIPAKTARRSNGKALKIPVHGSLLAMLSETPEEQRNGYIMPGLVEEYQFKNTRGTYLVKRISEVFKACKIETQCKVEGYSRLGVDVGFHSLRHSFVSLSANAGSSLAAVQAVVGHSNPSMTRHYLHADQTLVQNAVYALPDVTDNKSMGDEKAATTEEIDTVKKVVERMTAEQLKQLAHQVRAAIAKTEFQQAPEQIPACA